MGFGKTIKKTYMKAKKKAYGSRGVKGRYYRVGAVQGLKNLAKDIEMIKGRLNVEKKFKDRDVLTHYVGQSHFDTDGAYYNDVTPVISQGVNDDQRVGNSLKLTGLTLPMQFSQQTNCLGDRKVRVTLLRVRCATNEVDTSEAFQQVWDVNPLTQVRDFNAPRAYRNSKTDGITVIRSKVYHIKGPQLDNGGIGIDQAERNCLSCRFSVKLNDILRYANNAATDPDGIRYYIVIQADAGNTHPTGVSTLDIPVKSNSSGLDIRLGQRSWWVDN